jgi:hypothetical protein
VFGFFGGFGHEVSRGGDAVLVHDFHGDVFVDVEAAERKGCWRRRMWEVDGG